MQYIAGMLFDSSGFIIIEDRYDMLSIRTRHAAAVVCREAREDGWGQIRVFIGDRRRFISSLWTSMATIRYYNNTI